MEEEHAHVLPEAMVRISQVNLCDVPKEKEREKGKNGGVFGVSVK